MTSDPIQLGFTGRGFFQSYKWQYHSMKWRRFSLAFLHRRRFICQDCGRRASQTHHERYIPGRLLWEYEDRDLTPLCDSCHKVRHGILVA